MKLNSLFAALAFAVVAVAAQAHEYTLGSIQIGHPHARATAVGQMTGGGYLKLHNQGDDDRLLSAGAGISDRVELHSMKMEGDVMRMRQIEAVELPAGRSVELKPGGLHIMFVGLKAPLKAGDTFPMTLKFERAGEVTVDVKVEAAGAGAGGHRHDMKH